MANCERGSFKSDMAALLESGKDADVTISVGGSEHQVHSVVLAARSPVFGAMLRNNMLESNSHRIEVTDIPEAVLRQLLVFVYTDDTPELQSVPDELLAAADKYDLPALKERCERQLVGALSVENAAAAVALAVLHCCPRLESAALGFIAGHPEVMATAGWAQLLRGNTKTAVEVCSLLAATPARPKMATKETSTDTLSDIRIVPQETREKMVTKLMHAARYGRAQEVWALLAAGASKDSRDADGNTTLHLAVKQGHHSCARMLLDGGADPSAVNRQKQTPLHVAAQGSEANMVWMLVAASAQVDARDDAGQTPLHLAAQASNAQAVSALLLAGASRHIKDNTGKTPEGIATSFTIASFTIYSDLL